MADWLVFRNSRILGQSFLALVFASMSCGLLISQPKPDLTELAGERITETTFEDARALTVISRTAINRIRKTTGEVPPEVAELYEAADKGFQENDWYRAYRLFVRLLAVVQDEEVSEEMELVASYDLRLSRAITGPGDEMNVSLLPLFTLGNPLSGIYMARCWLEFRGGIVSGSEKQLPISEVKPQQIAYSTASLEPGAAGVGYELISPSGKQLIKFSRAFLHTTDAVERLEKLEKTIKKVEDLLRADASVSEAAAVETIKYVARSLRSARTSYVGDFRRTARPMAVKYRSIRDPLVWRGPLRYPEDLELAETLSSDLLAGKDPLASRSGDMHLAYKSPFDGELVPYRMFVPDGYNPEKPYPLIITLHGASGNEHSWFDRPGQDGQGANPFRRLAQERGYLAAAPSGRGPFEGYSGIGGQDVLDVLARTQAVYNIDPKRVYLTGHSLGGGGTWTIGFRHAEKFRAIAPIAANARWLREEYLTARADLPVLFSQGARDMTVLVEPSRRTAELAKRYLKDFTYNEYPEDTHSSIWYSAQESIFDFFDKH